MSKTESIIDGFEFADLKEAMQAAKEVEGVRYIRSKTDMDNPEMVLQIYNKMVSQEMFDTVVGHCYLKELQNYLYDARAIADHAILPIKIERPAAYEAAGEDIAPAGEPIRQETSKIPVLPRVTENTQPGGKVSHTDYKLRSQVFGIASAVLAACVILMFVIMATSGSPNIINYENELIDKYEQWEQELVERENAVKERERQLGQN